ncbi:MAG: SRPBCC domain-containing protein [Bacteroidota bacterium]
MEKELIIKNTIIINAPSHKVWDVLINPQQTKKYMFGCETVSDWKVGSELLWKGVFDGVELVAVKGHVVAFHPEKLLAYTTIDPNSSTPDQPENYTTVTYSLTEKNGDTELIITQGDYSKVADGEKRYNDSLAGGGWGSIMLEMKRIAEE